MEYVFGVSESSDYETVLTKGAQHSDYTGGIQKVVRDLGDQTITDTFRVIEREWTAEDSAGYCYDRYTIDRHYRVIDKAPGIRREIAEAREESLVPSSIVFVTLAEAGTIDQTTAGEHSDLFAEWQPDGVHYEAGNLRRYNGKLWRCIQPHSSQPDYTPDKAVSLWTQAADPAEEWPQWSQPVGAFDAYQTGDKVTYQGRHYTSLIDNNVWPPDTYPQGWKQEE